MSHSKKDLQLINDYLQDNLPSKLAQGRSLQESIEYSLLATGKRVRGLLFLSMIRAAKLDSTKFISFAAALEALHCYTLIHDDLPALDDDDFRRGKHSNHKVYGEATAILAGDALLTFSFELATKKLPIAAELQLKMINRLAELSGSQELIVGQQADLDAAKNGLSGDTCQQLKFIYQKKTGSLIKSSLDTAAIAANFSAELRLKIMKLAELLGVHYQITDDILEHNDSSEDKTEDKNLSYLKYFSLSEAEKKVESLKSQLIDGLADLPADFDELNKIFRLIISRQS